MLRLITCIFFLLFAALSCNGYKLHPLKTFSRQRSTFSEHRAVQPGAKAPEAIINENIKANRVRLLLPGDTPESADVMAGIFTLSEALEKAEEMELDLVLINDQADPPVCKIVDYGKHKYALEKKKKENMKKQTRSDMKEVKLSNRIEQHDFEVRVRAAQKFLLEGDRVKVLIQFRGREMQHKEIAQEVMVKFFNALQSAAMEGPPKMEGRSMMMILAPKKGA